MIAAIALFVTQGSLLDKVITNPTGLNGYEEYVAAAQVLDRPDNRAMERFVRAEGDGFLYGETKAPRPAAVPEKATPLDIYRIQAKAVAPAIELIRQGNLKPTSYPNHPITTVTLFPELSLFRTAARVIQRSAYVSFADGNSAAGTRLLIDGLTFSRKMQVGGMYHLYVGQSCEQLMLTEIERDLQNLSLKDVHSLQSWLRTNGGSLAKSATEAAERARISSHADFNAFVANPSEYFEMLEVDSKAAKEMTAGLKQVSEKTRDQLYDSLFKRMEAPWSSLIDRLKSPEREWLAPLAVEDFIEGGEVPNLEGLNSDARAGLFAYIRLLSLFDEPNQDERRSILLARYNIQERVLGLTLAVLEYRWVNGKLPATLGAIFGKEPLDIATGQPYVYEQRLDSNFRVYAQVKGLGDVGLTYKSAQAGDKEIPPPASRTYSSCSTYRSYRS